MFRRSLTRSSKPCLAAMPSETNMPEKWTSSEKNLRECRWRFPTEFVWQCRGRVLRVNTRLLKRRHSWSWTRLTKRSTSWGRRWTGTLEKVAGWVTSEDAQLVYDSGSAKMVIDGHGWSLVIIWWINQRPFPGPTIIPSWLFSLHYLLSSYCYIQFSLNELSSIIFSPRFCSRNNHSYF